MPSNIYFVGLMGCGKTTIGKLLASELNLEFFDSDSVIVTKANLSINEIFQKYGESYFRKLEINAIRELSNKHNVVISLGGGAVINATNIDCIKKNGKVIYLQASIDCLVDRLKNAQDRPLLNNTDNLAQTLQSLLDKRASLYESAADIKIDTTKLSLECIINTLRKELNFH